MTGKEQAALNVQLAGNLASAALSAVGTIAGEKRIFDSLSSFVGAAGNNIASYQMSQVKPSATMTQVTADPTTAATKPVDPKEKSDSRIMASVKKYGVWVAAIAIGSAIIFIWKPWK